MKKSLVGMALIAAGWATQSDAAIIVNVDSATIAQPLTATSVSLDVYLGVTGADVGQTLSAYSVMVGVPSGLTAGSPVASLITSGPHAPAFNGGNLLLSAPVGNDYGVNDFYGSGGIALTDGLGLFKVNLNVPGLAPGGTYNVPISFVELTDDGGNTLTVDSTVTGVLTVAVPEPTSLGLIAVGGLLLCRRRP